MSNAPARRSFTSRIASPVWAAVRAGVSVLRGRQKAPTPRASYEGAQHSPLLADWAFAPIRSANQEIRAGHRVLVARARDLARNDPTARRYLSLQRTNIVGPHGIRLRCQIRDAAGNLDAVKNRAVEAAFTEWTRAEFCDAAGRRSWVEIQGDAVEGKRRDGEALLRLIPGFDNKFGFAVQQLDPDQLDIDFNRTRSGNGGNEIRMGVEIDRWGRAVAYHLWDEHPTEYTRRRERVRVPAEQIVHWFDADRPGQVRGVTRFAPVLVPMRHQHGYREAEVVAARTAATKMGFFTEEAEYASDPDPSKAREPLVMEAEPGRMELLPPGLKFMPWDPQHPTSAFPEFDSSMSRTIASGLDVAHASLTGDLSKVNYTSIRAGLVVERDKYREDQIDMADQVHRRVYLMWLRWSLTMGAVDLGTYDADSVSAHSWRPRGWAWVDPMKETQAALLQIKGRLNNRARVIAEMTGRDIEDVFEELAEEERLAELYGLALPEVSDMDTTPAPEPAPAPESRILQAVGD